MEYEIIREPYLFMEAMDLLYKYVNQIPFSSLWTPRIELSGTKKEQTILQRLELLQTIMDEVTVDLDRKDPDLLLFFEDAKRETGHITIFLAKYMTSAFMDFKHTGFEETVQDIYEEWELVQRKGYWLQSWYGDAGLQYSSLPGSPGDLFEQIYSLDLPAEFRLQLFGALHAFPEKLEKLAQIMRPVAAKLEKTIARYQIPLGEIAEYWLTSRMEPLEFLGNAMGAEAIAGAGNRLRLGISLMNANRIVFGMENDPGRQRDYSFMCIGCCISVTSQRKEQYAALDELSTILRGLSERKRLEALRQLAKKRMYGLELAEILNMDRGNLSRLLSVLHEQGFVKQEKENQRTYYRADKDAAQRFFDRVMTVIFD